MTGMQISSLGGKALRGAAAVALCAGLATAGLGAAPAVASLVGTSTGANSFAAYAATSVSFANHDDVFVTTDGSGAATADLFDGLKGLMPGDSRAQTITVSNDDPDGLPVRIYLAAEVHDTGANADGLPAAEFLRALDLTVTMDGATVYSGTADVEADSILLGTFANGQQRTLTATVSMPIELGNEYANHTGEVDWVFTVEEDDAPQPPAPDNPNNPGTPTTPGGGTPGGGTTPAGTTAATAATPGVPPAGNPVTPVVAPVAEALENAAEAITGNATPQAGPDAQEQMGDEETPLADLAYDCWVHFYLWLCLIATAIYTVCVVARRAKSIHDIDDIDKQITGTADGASAGSAAPRVRTGIGQSAHA